VNLVARAKYLLDNFKLTIESWTKIHTYQYGKCAICGHTLIKANTDHDHKTGEVRGLLCARCNRALGRFGDSLDLLRAAVIYLEEPPARKALGYIHIGYPGRIGTKKHRKMIQKLKKNMPQPISIMERTNESDTKSGSKFDIKFDA
jgi:Recombination endonuclease VII